MWPYLRNQGDTLSAQLMFASSYLSDEGCTHQPTPYASARRKSRAKNSAGKSYEQPSSLSRHSFDRRFPVQRDAAPVIDELGFDSSFGSFHADIDMARAAARRPKSHAPSHIVFCSAAAFQSATSL
jgi:hypothetical protein